ncbi:DUF1289 domain-containing protein [Gynuella sunshinyii]|uniref:DUF1289 domain-containing protein n=1 Tax=Gynuella sunshinyii TaxID=1445505 RepID=UPI0005CC32DA|nr:DUF1289 domain-containing protein [Gynuella sunshinyii]
MESIASPCVRNCCLDDSEVCLGCGRTLQEIKDWWNCSNSDKRLIIRRAQTRQQRRLNRPLDEEEAD